WTPSGTPQLNGVAERRNQTLLDMVRSMMSFMELPPSFWGYALETAGLSYIQKKLRDTIFYDPSMQKVFISRNTVFLKKDFSSDSRRDEILLEESSEEPQHDSTTSFETPVRTDSVLVLRRSTRESRVPKKYGFVGLTSQLDNNQKTYREAMSDIDSNMWLQAMESKMDSMGSNQVWTLVDQPKDVRLVAKGYTQRPVVDFEETYSPVAMAKSIRILLAITKNQKVCRLQGSIYDLKQASRSWNTRFDEVIRVIISSRTSMILVYTKKISGSSVAYLVLYVDHILLIGNDVKLMDDCPLSFFMKDMGEASYILGIKICRDRSRRMLGLTQSSYIEKVLKSSRWRTQNEDFFL
ncbi:UNVERIFIED_CONTAM: hypothetical protein Slati_2930200, partial [Sesamum latifolium]